MSRARNDQISYDRLLYTCIIEDMEPVHVQVLDAARVVAAANGTFRIAEVVQALPHLNAATVRTHVASRCCMNAPSNHQSRYAYFRAIRRGVYSIMPRFRVPRGRRERASQDDILARLPSGVDRTLLIDSFAKTPTERLETMRSAALSLEVMRAR
jgi:hypothetical protein